ncbi:MAG: formate--tetrahydrofolate ligase, partial [Clostridia bacterium]|nr:formate--tetrahydrofolate ligase [Clostridia bacterium]
MDFKSDIEIANSVKPKNILKIAQTAGIPSEYIEQYGKYKAKIDLRFLKENKNPDGKLILVSAITPTPAGEGKT